MGSTYVARISDGGQAVDMPLVATCYAAAAEEAQALPDRGDYDPTAGTLYVDIDIIRLRDGAEELAGSLTVQLDEPEPGCEHSDGHRWVYDGVRSNGGGVVVTEYCPRCGLAQVTDTWAQRRDTGEQGFREITYRAHVATGDLEEDECDREDA